MQGKTKQAMSLREAKIRCENGDIDREVIDTLLGEITTQTNNLFLAKSTLKLVRGGAFSTAKETEEHINTTLKQLGE